MPEHAPVYGAAPTRSTAGREGRVAREGQGNEGWDWPKEP